MASNGIFCQKAVSLEQKVGQRIAKIAKTLDLQGFVRCRTTFVISRSRVQVTSPAYTKKTVNSNGISGLFYNIGNCAQSVRNFACFKKVYLFAPKSGGRCLPVASGYRRPEQSGDRGLK